MAKKISRSDPEDKMEIPDYEDPLLKKLIDENMIEVVVNLKFKKFEIAIRREVDLEKAAKILQCDEKIILHALRTGRLPGRRVDSKHLIEVNDLFLLGVLLETKNGSKKEREKLHKKLDREWEKELKERLKILEENQHTKNESKGRKEKR